MLSFIVNFLLQESFWSFFLLYKANFLLIIFENKSFLTKLYRHIEIFLSLSTLIQIAEVFYYVNYGSSIITSNFCQKFFVFSLLFLLSNLKYISNKCFQDKMWFKMPRWIFWATSFKIWKHQCWFFMFSLLKFIWRTFDEVIDVQYLTS